MEQRSRSEVGQHVVPLARLKALLWTLSAFFATAPRTDAALFRTSAPNLYTEQKVGPASKRLEFSWASQNSSVSGGTYGSRAVVSFSSHRTSSDLESWVRLARGGANNADTEPGNRPDRITAPKAVALNILSWAALVTATLAWDHARPATQGGIVRKTLVGAVVGATTVQVASNVLQAIHGPGNAGAIPSGGRPGKETFVGLKTLRWTYLAVCAIAGIGEFVQGAYIYILYRRHAGLSSGQVSKLFLAGTISSMIAGPLAGSFLDRYGRRTGCMLWAALNVVQCLLIRSKTLGVILVGRVVAGVSSTLFATGFESWMVSQHLADGFPAQLLGDTFRMATWGIGIAAIAGGFLSDAAVKHGGIVAPFNLAIGMSLLALGLIRRFWNENYGDASFSALKHMRQAVGYMIRDRRMLMLGLVQVLFDGALLTWTVVWIPAVLKAQQNSSSQNNAVAFGTVLSTLMMCMCSGSALFKILTEGLPQRFILTPEGCVILATGLGTTALAAASRDQQLGSLLLLFLTYEVAIGLYTPAIMTCRSKFIDDRFRGAVMNFFRVPMNLVVALMMVGPVARVESSSAGEGVASVLRILAGLTGAATVVQALLMRQESERVAAVTKEWRDRRWASAADARNAREGTA